MSYPEGNLKKNERIAVDLNPHWWHLVPTGSALFAAIVVGGLILWKLPDDGTGRTALQVLGVALLLVTLVPFIGRLVEWRMTHFVVTSERCIYRSGVLQKHGIEIPIDRISAVYFSQTVFERMLNSGDIGIESSGEGSRQDFNDIKDPAGVQNIIYQQMEENEDQRHAKVGQGIAEAYEGFGGSQKSVADELSQLVELRDQGVITAEEFETQKARLLNP